MVCSLYRVKTNLLPFPKFTRSSPTVITFQAPDHMSYYHMSYERSFPNCGLIWSGSPSPIAMLYIPFLGTNHVEIFRVSSNWSTRPESRQSEVLCRANFPFRERHNVRKECRPLPWSLQLDRSMPKNLSHSNSLIISCGAGIYPS